MRSPDGVCFWGPVLPAAFQKTPLVTLGGVSLEPSDRLDPDNTASYRGCEAGRIFSLGQSTRKSLETAGLPYDHFRSLTSCPMHIHLTPQSIEALAMIISGGGGNDHTPPIGIYRSASKLESFMRNCNVAMSVGTGSRLPALIEALEQANDGGDQVVLKTSSNGPQTRGIS